MRHEALLESGMRHEALLESGMRHEALLESADNVLSYEESYHPV